MKNLKKVIALIAVLALTLSTVALGATYTDVAEDSAYSVAVESLSKLGIVTGYEDGTYGPEKAVTRAEMAALIARIQGYEETASAQTATVFADVPASHWASGYVAAASNMGIVNGYGDGTFGPEDSVKYEQAVTMIMRTLGYEPFAAANGGYPTGYLAAAQRYGLTKNVSNAVSGTDANRGTIAQLLYNGIDTPLMAQSKWGTNGDIEYTIYDGTSGKAYKTLMSENLGVVKIKGIVSKNIVSDIDNASVTIDTEKEETVTIKLTSVYDTTDKFFYSDYAAKIKKASMEFEVADSDIAEALGYSVVAYVVEDEIKDNVYDVVSYAIDSATNTVVEFTLDQFAGKKDANTIEYYKNATDNNKTELKFEAGAKVVYNFDGAYSVNTIFGNAPVTVNTSASGKVVAIDNNTTFGYDVAIVEVSNSKVVKKATADKVAFKAGSSLEVDANATDKIIKLTKAGEAIAHTDLAEWDVVTVLSRADGKYIEAEVIGSTLVGKVEATRKSDTSAATGNKAYRIEGNYYDVALGAYEADNIEIGEGGTFYIDANGKIVAFNEDATLVGGAAGTYAYVIEAGKNTAFNTEYAQIRLLTANGVDIYDVAEEISLNGTDVKIVADSAAANAGDVEVTTLTTALTTAQMILYNVNASGEIDEIDGVAAATYDNATIAATAEFAQVAASSAAWDADNFSLGGIVDEDAVVFLLAPSATRKTESKVGTLADLEDGETYGYIKYLDDKGDDANVVLITTGYANVGQSSGVAVVTEVAFETKDGDDALFVKYLQGGEAKQAYTSETVYNSVKGWLTPGDIIKVKLTEGVITSVDGTHKIDLNEGVRTGISGKATNKVTNGKEEYVFGVASTHRDTTTAVTVRNFGSVRLDKAENVYVIDDSGKNIVIKTGDAWNYNFLDEDYKDVEKLEDYIFIRKYDGAIKDVVIVKANLKSIDLTAAQKTTISTLKGHIANINAALDASSLADTETIATIKAHASVDAAADTALDNAVTAASLTDASTAADVITAIEALIPSCI